MLFRAKYKNLIKFKRYYLKYKKLIRVLIIVMLMASSLGMLLPYFVSKRLVGLTNNISIDVIIYSVMIIVTIIFHHIFWYYWEKLSSVLTNKVIVDIRNDITKSFLDTKYSEIKVKTSGYYLERINDDALEVSSYLSNVLGTLVDTITNFSFLILIYFISYKCGIIFTIGIIILYLIDSLKVKRDMHYTELIKDYIEKFNSKINENFRGIKDIKGLGIKDITIKSTNELSMELSSIQVKKDKSYAMLSRLKTLTQNIIEAVLFIFSILYLIPSGGISVVALLTIIDYSGFMYDLVGFFAKMKDYFVKGDYKAGRILEILDSNNYEKYGNKNINVNNFNIRINNLSYSYDNKKQVLNNVSLEIKENTLNLLVGSSGSGKSTLFGLLTKLLPCQNNKIFIDNKDINLFNEDTLRDIICVINQEPFLLNDTIINNLKIVNEKATYIEIINACKQANIYDEIMEFKNGFDTLINENANNLSGGQKQRLSIVRAILKDSPILLFDEPTSAMDKRNQEMFFDSINRLKDNKTILVIAHKFNNYDDFDSVYEIDNGYINKYIKN